ncbi:MAG: putative DNA binding domain-containing protein [gamma proteobacterium symbiont of Taylorina sp.]|nr:putative DNA binding domain-containing protein [gamma proteobacterium symbiont of Taylorina sp.]
MEKFFLQVRIRYNLFMPTDSINTYTPSSTSVRRRLTRDLTLLVLLLISLFVFLSYLYSKQIQKNITIAVIDATQNLSIEKNNRLFEPITNNLVLSKKWAQLEYLTPEKHNVFNKRFIPILETLPQISSVILASSDGREYFFTKRDDDWVSRYINPEKNGTDSAVWKQWSSNNQLIKQWEENTSYRPLERPWYQLGITSDQKTPIKWTEPYSFYTKQIPGITGVTSWIDKNITYVLAFDVTLTEVAASLTNTRVSKNEISYLMSAQGEVILPPGNKHEVKGSSKEGSLYAPGKDMGNYIIFDSVNHWLNRNKPLEQINTFSRNGNVWWYKIFNLEQLGHSIYTGVIVPEKDLTDVISENFKFMLIGILILIFIAVIMAKFLVKKYAHQLKDVPKTSIANGDFSNEIYHLLREGESETLEFKSTMRKNLKSGKNGKEIEIAWLKGLVGFMNTNGGILLIGVDDDSNILGIEADEFENEDKVLLHFKNLISQHIGLEFSHYIHLIINRIEEKMILVIECERASRPVFLYHKNEEYFYIRSGPASVKLSISKVIRYIQNRYN